MRIAFLGTPDFAVPTLAGLIGAGHQIVRVYSQPPAPRGRGQGLRPSAVHAFAQAQGLTVSSPASMKSPQEMSGFAALDLDAAVVVAFGQILAREVLEAPRLGSFNLHASLLPRWRGAAPIQRAIMAGDLVTGACVMRMTVGLDEGPVLARIETAIGDLDTAATLHDTLAAAGAQITVQTMAAVATGVAVETPQAAEGVTYARKLRPSETRVRWDAPAAAVDRQIRGLSPFPGTWFLLPSANGPVRVKALLSKVQEGSGEAGTALDDALLIACGSGAVRLMRVQREGRTAQDALEFVRGFPVAGGVRLA
jgi:methionyl-tRNA formyltransferase